MKPHFDDVTFERQDDRPPDNLGRVHFAILWFQRHALDTRQTRVVFEDGTTGYRRGQYFFADPNGYAQRMRLAGKRVRGFVERGGA